MQGHWEKSTAALERANTLDPRNVELLGHLALNYEWGFGAFEIGIGSWIG